MLIYSTSYEDVHSQCDIRFTNIKNTDESILNVFQFAPEQMWSCGHFPLRHKSYSGYIDGDQYRYCLTIY